MTLLNLPLELFREILAHATRQTELKDVLRLRIVSTIFNSEVVDLIFKNKLLDGYGPPRFTTVGGAMPSFATAYLADRILNEPADGAVPLLKVRQIAEALLSRQDLSAERYDRQLRLCVPKLAALVMQHHRTWTLRIMFERYGSSWMYNFIQDLFSAAAYVRDVDLIKEQLEMGHMPWQSGLFGDFDKVAAMSGVVSDRSIRRKTPEEWLSALKGASRC